MIRIRSKKEGFRRCGIAHSMQWTEYPEGAFSADQIAKLKADPMLAVEIVVPDPPEPPEQAPDLGDEEPDATPPQVSGLSPQPSKRKGRKG